MTVHRASGTTTKSSIWQVTTARVVDGRCAGIRVAMSNTGELAGLSSLTSVMTWSSRNKLAS